MNITTSKMALKKEIKRKGINKNGYSRVPRNILDFLLDAKKQGLTIHSLRIVLIMLARVQENQITTERQLDLFEKDLDLFERDFTDTTKHTNYTVQFNFLWKDLLPENSRNYSSALKGLQELLNYRGVHDFENDKGEKIKLFSSIISDLLINEGKRGVKFTMNILWYKMFLLLRKNNKFNANNFSNKIIFKYNHINCYVWYFYLKALGTNNDSSLFLDTFNDIFSTNYKNWSKCKEKFLTPYKELFDEVSDVSFNFWIEGDKLKIHSYSTSEPEAIPVYENPNITTTIKRTLKYQKKKYKLSDIEFQMLEVMYKTYGYERISKRIKNNPELKNLTGKEYVEKAYEISKRNLNDKEDLFS
ncbi:hypothetical protein Q361_11740 [Flavobacterium croceum DSM 17960]|uniref:Uncharacterized protein n=1 Tax=Flavobacterium croceum DSM 17960 TaxID=1121886 RepID=A0A2S4N5J0_9FLAO|nr:hypothetical protein [Flavobacterium croceum]POS00936.1 hypothetical protein Q361_11740 [Flavobacterium croceum DSM 17960]